MTHTEQWIVEDNPLYDVECEQLIRDLVDEGHELQVAIDLVETLGVKIEIPEQ